ncbi:YceK/YidQ family lipoprotein [Pseudomonas capeferrum]|uniref:YceK/YidQ family lipoprotein n=1 Tax=Pseudomonas capeferrum TaxID=1495066 RepID=UPI00280BD3B6|nr:YceK/YidQ family lipoprotein [Pseudomonas capeferrum]
MAYQFCNLDGPPRSGAHWAAPTIVLDMGLSGIADTVMLPYTGYHQFKHRNIPIRHKQY